MRDPLQVASALLVVNRPSGRGRQDEEVARLQSAFYRHFDPIPHKTFALTQGHDQVIQCTRNWVTLCPGPHFLLSGGGGGTNRALVQGLLEEVQQGTTRLQDAQIGSLRLGSGNLVPRHFGLPRDAVEGMRRIADDLFAGRSSPCCVYCCTFYEPGGKTRREYGIAMGGLGQFGRVPDDIQRWRDAHPRLMRWACRMAALETINTWQYVAFSVARVVKCIIHPRRAEAIDLAHAGRSERFRLLIGVLLNLDIPQFPIRARCDIGEPRLALCLIPHAGRAQTAWALLHWHDLDRRARRYEITPEQPIEITFPEDGSTTLALDEDTFVAPARIGFQVAAVVRFVTGARPG